MTLISNDVLSIVEMNKDMYFDVYKNSLDEDNKRFVPDEVFDSVETAKKAVDQIIENYKLKEGAFVYAIIRNVDKKYIGHVQLIKINEGWEIGYHIAQPYTGKGCATDALSLFLNYIKHNTNIKEVYGVVLKENAASRRVLEKCDFKVIYEGKANYRGEQKDVIKTIKCLE